MAGWPAGRYHTIFFFYFTWQRSSAERVHCLLLMMYAMHAVLLFGVQAIRALSGITTAACFAGAATMTRRIRGATCTMPRCGLGAARAAHTTARAAVHSVCMCLYALQPNCRVHKLQCPPPSFLLVQGVISVTSNIIPGLFSTLMQQASVPKCVPVVVQQLPQSDAALATSCAVILPPCPAPLLQRDDATAASLDELISWLFCEPNPIPL